MTVVIYYRSVWGDTMKYQCVARKLSAFFLAGLLLASSSFAAPLVRGGDASGGLADAGVINQQRILYWLVKRGELASDASDVERRDALAAFTARAKGYPQNTAVILSRLERQQRLRAKSLPSTRTMSFAAARADTDISKTVKVLAILIDFPDLPHDNNRLSAGDTSMYYPSYSQAHYQDLMFSTSGFAGPQGQNLISAYQYYQAASGGSLFFTGNVKGWYTASQNAAYYGENDPNNSDDDQAVPELVKEAVTQALANMTPAEIDTYDVEDPYDLDGDGNLNEADGDIDHVMLFHSSIGEEAGGGVLGRDAIWSHRYFVYHAGAPGYAIAGTNKKVFGYTIQPIDAAAGVVVHEFGHALGLPDEYDTTNTGDGSPVGDWSIMSSGSWSGELAGTQPVGFSPYARSYLQDKYRGNWVRELQVDLDSIPVGGQEVRLVEAVNYDQVNQIALRLPAVDITFKAPYSGAYQYYSNQGNLLSTAAAVNIDFPASNTLTLKMKAHWDIELNYDYAQVMIDGVALKGNYTRASNGINGATNIITGTSADIGAAEGVDNWVDLTFDVSGYAGSTGRQLSIVYRTDDAVGGYGLVVDDIGLFDGNNRLYFDGAEAAGVMQLTGGFVRIDNNRPGGERRYLVQLRSHNGLDAGLASRDYEPGVLLWLENLSEVDNNVSNHPGRGLIGVVDADQNLIGNAATQVQIRDATFSMFNQSRYFNDNHLSAISLFDDRRDYSAPLQPQSGLVLPVLGLTMEVIEQQSDSSVARVRFEYRSESVNLPSANFDYVATELRVAFSNTTSGGSGPFSYVWAFGDGSSSTDISPTHTYANTGRYQVTLTVTDGSNNQSSVTQTVIVATTRDEDTGSDSGGGGSLGWMALSLLLLLGYRFCGRKQQ